MLVKVAGAALNPSDRYRVLGVYMPPVLPCVVGLEGTGIVEQAQGEAVQHWVGKRVSFIA